MLLTIQGAISVGDLGYLLHKNPARPHEFELSVGKAHLYYPEAGDRASVAVLLDVDPVSLVRGSGKPGSEGALDQYVNDRPYAASSFLSVALLGLFRTAMLGVSKERQHLADQALPWTAVVTALPCRGGESILRRLFEPLGYSVAALHHSLDEKFPEWGDGPYFTVTLSGRARLKDLLTHLYVLIPVLDAEKHYWVGSAEVEKLLKKGEGWLSTHPEKELIASRYLRYDRKLTLQALAQLVDDDMPDPEEAERRHSEEEQSLEAPVRLWEQRIEAILSVLRASGAKSVLDLGCGEGKLPAALLKERGIDRIVGVDVSWRNLEIARRRLFFDQMPDAQRARIDLWHGSLMYRDSRFQNFDAAVVSEVIEHFDPPRLAAFERVVFEHARPKLVVITTPNAGYNAKFESLPAGRFRHKDHRFEWTRAEFADWGAATAARFGYQVRFAPVGPEDAVCGAPTQMGVFTC